MPRILSPKSGHTPDDGTSFPRACRRVFELTQCLKTEYAGTWESLARVVCDVECPGADAGSETPPGQVLSSQPLDIHHPRDSGYHGTKPYLKIPGPNPRKWRVRRWICPSQPNDAGVTVGRPDDCLSTPLRRRRIDTAKMCKDLNIIRLETHMLDPTCLRRRPVDALCTSRRSADGLGRVHSGVSASFLARNTHLMLHLPS